MSTSRRRAVVRIDSPTIQAINHDNTIGVAAAERAVHGQSAARSDSNLRDAVPEENSHAVSESTVDHMALPKHPAPTAPQGASIRSSVAMKKTISFRAGLTSRAVIDTAAEIAATHHGDPELVLRRFVRDALATLHARITTGDLADFAPVGMRPHSLLALDTSTRITPDNLDRLAARIDPMGVFRPSAVIGFAVDQILTERHGR